MNTFWLVQILGALAILFTLALWFLPKWQVSHSLGTTSENGFERENEARKTLAQVLGGIVLVAGFYSSARTLQLQTSAIGLQEKSIEQAKISQSDSVKATKDGQITDRYTRAIEQLEAGDDKHAKIEVRAGAIYALGRIANESRDDQRPIMEVLTMYATQISQSERPQDRPRADVQAALTVIGRRRVEWDSDNPEPLRLILAKIARAWLPNSDFHGFYLSGADLSGAYLMGAHLEGASFEGANLSGAHLTGAHLNGAHLRSARFTGADLRGCDLTGASDMGSAQIAEAIKDGNTRLPSQLE